MKVAHIIRGLGVGGAEVALANLIAATRNTTQHLVLAIGGDGALVGRFRSSGAQVVRSSRPGITLRTLRQFNPDVLVGQMYHGSLAATALQSFLRKTPMIWSIHHSVDDIANEKPATRLALRLCAMLSARAAKIHYVSRRSASQHESLGFPAAKTCVVPNGCDLSRYRFDGAARLQARAELGFLPDDFVFGHVGRVHPMKDHGNLLTALALAHRQNPKIAAVLCGRGTENLNVPASLHGRIRLLGVRSDIPALMSGCDAGVLSSAFGEALPNVLAEFQGCERICTTTDVGDAPLMVGDSHRVAAPRNPVELAEDMLHISLMGADELRKRGNEARKAVQTKYDINTVSETMFSLWQTA